MPTPDHRLQPDPPEGARDVVDRELARTDRPAGPGGLDLEGRIGDAIAEEIARQFADGRGTVSRDPAEPTLLAVDGTVDLDAVAAVVAGTLAGGP